MICLFLIAGLVSNSVAEQLIYIYVAFSLFSLSRV